MNLTKNERQQLVTGESRGNSSCRKGLEITLFIFIAVNLIYPMSRSRPRRCSLEASGWRC